MIIICCFMFIFSFTFISLSFSSIKLITCIMIDVFAPINKAKARDERERRINSSASATCVIVRRVNTLLHYCEWQQLKPNRTCVHTRRPLFGISSLNRIDGRDACTLLASTPIDKCCRVSLLWLGCEHTIFTIKMLNRSTMRSTQ